MKLEFCYTTELLPHVMNYKGRIMLKNDCENTGLGRGGKKKKKSVFYLQAASIIFDWRPKIKTM